MSCQQPMSGAMHIATVTGRQSCDTPATELTMMQPNTFNFAEHAYRHKSGATHIITVTNIAFLCAGVWA